MTYSKASALLLLDLIAVRFRQKLLTMTTHLEFSKWNRPIIYVAEWSDANGASGSCVFQAGTDAIKWAIMQAILMGQPDWERFPDPDHGSYPYADMDGSREDLSPLFRVTWQGGFATVERREAEREFMQAAGSLMDRTLEVYKQIVANRSV
jgi:hypothetical protein